MVYFNYSTYLFRQRLCSRLTALWRFINFVLLLLVLLLLLCRSRVTLYLSNWSMLANTSTSGADSLWHGALWVEEQQTRKWPNCTDHHENAHRKRLFVHLEPKKWRGDKNISGVLCRAPTFKCARRHCSSRYRPTRCANHIDIKMLRFPNSNSLCFFRVNHTSSMKT